MLISKLCIFQCVNCRSAREHPDKKLRQQMNFVVSRLNEQHFLLYFGENGKGHVRVD